jgi:hypothetical protein
MSARPEAPESRLSAHLLSDTGPERSSIVTRNAKTSKADNRSIDPDEAGLVQMTFASEGILRFGSLKDSIKQ